MAVLSLAMEFAILSLEPERPNESQFFYAPLVRECGASEQRAHSLSLVY